MISSKDLEVLDTSHYGLGHHDHARSTPINVVIDLSVSAQPVAAQIHQLQREEAPGLGPAQNGMLQWADQEFREDTDDGNMHSKGSDKRKSGKFMRLLPARKVKLTEY
jgi:hypothetical protein